MSDLETALRAMADAARRYTLNTNLKLATRILEAGADAIAATRPPVSETPVGHIAYRFVVCVDVGGRTLDEAYGNLLDRMNGNDWESSDEVYDPEGVEVDEDELSAMRLRVLATRPGV